MIKNEEEKCVQQCRVIYTDEIIYLSQYDDRSQ
jgi:hypothetical protein